MKLECSESNSCFYSNNSKSNYYFSDENVTRDTSFQSAKVPISSLKIVDFTPNIPKS